MKPEFLIGKRLQNGWVIEKCRPSFPEATGGCQSLGYIARRNDGGEAFVKLLDTTVNEDNSDPIADLKLRLDVFQYERRLVEKCCNHKMSRIVRAIGFGKLENETASNPVYYLIFELAECDLREQVDLDHRFNLACRLRVLHQTAVGLKQLHWANIAHQDLKPSNVLVFPDNETKLGDLGHAQDRNEPRPGRDTKIAADHTYAPPEQLYGHIPEDWDVRRLSADLYHLGSLAVFLFTGIGLTPSLYGQLRPEHHWDVWMGNYRDVLPYVREAMDAVLDELADATDLTVREELVTLVRYLTDPEPTKRCHPRNLAGNRARYGLDRFVSRFDVLAGKTEFALRTQLRA